MQCNELEDLSSILKDNGDKLLDASSKLSISTGLLRKMNESFKTIFNSNESFASNFYVLPETDNILDEFLDLQLLYDFVQKTIGLKLFASIVEYEDVDISIFRNLKLLEVHRFSFNLLRGLRKLRTQLEYLICIKGANTLKDVLQNCGGDRVQGHIWNELKEVVFCHNGLNDLDGSLEFVPRLISIDLSHNNIKNADGINSLSNLRYLNLSFNYLPRIPAFSGNLSTVLRVLILRNNYIEAINEVSLLVNLQDLDLSNNFLIDHDILYPLTNLNRLKRLKLLGNPLSYHKFHRNQTVRHLNILNVAEFRLDDLCLSKGEVRSLGSYSCHAMDSSVSSTSTTLNTVLQADGFSTEVNDANKTSDMDVSVDSSLLIEQSEVPAFWVANQLEVGEVHGMQDSGFVAGPRPASPDGSIEKHSSASEPTQMLVVAEIHKDSANPCSASSLQSSTEDTIKHCESDIEILSNPSQSSIEVLSSRSGLRYVHSSTSILPQAVSDPSTKLDLRRSLQDLHKSY